MSAIISIMLHRQSPACKKIIPRLVSIRLRHYNIVYIYSDQNISIMYISHIPRTFPIDNLLDHPKSLSCFKIESESIIIYSNKTHGDKKTERWERNSEPVYLYISVCDDANGHQFCAAGSSAIFFVLNENLSAASVYNITYASASFMPAPEKGVVRRRSIYIDI